MTEPVVHLADLPLQPRPAQYLPAGATAQRIEMNRAFVGAALGLSHLGCSLVEVPPGKQAFAYHSHWRNDEMFVMLSGVGELRLGGRRYALRPGDVVGCPAGGPETAHAITNTGDAPLRYLAVSSELMPDTCEYPDSGKTAFFDDRPGPTPGSPPQPFSLVVRGGREVDFWDGE